MNGKCPWGVNAPAGWDARRSDIGQPKSKANIPTRRLLIYIERELLRTKGRGDGPTRVARIYLADRQVESVARLGIVGMCYQVHLMSKDQGVALPSSQ
jgi:hypothetical protein